MDVVGCIDMIYSMYNEEIRLLLLSSGVNPASLQRISHVKTLKMEKRFFSAVSSLCVYRI